MKTKVFIMAMLLMPVMFGCSKDNSVEKQIVGNWFQFYYEQTNEDYVDPSFNSTYSQSYTQEEADAFYSFDENGTYSYSNGEGVVEGTGSWSIDNGRLSISEDGVSMEYDIEFNGDNQFYMIYRVEYDEGGAITTNPDEAAGITTTRVGLQKM